MPGTDDSKKTNTVRPRTWRDRCRPLIAELLAGCEGRPLNERKRIANAGKVGMFRCTSHGRKTWNDEVNVQLGLKPPPGNRRKPKQAGPKENPDGVLPGQTSLFGGSA